MESKESPQSLFEKEYKYAYNELKKLFLSRMKTASEKEYTYNYYKKLTLKGTLR